MEISYGTIPLMKEENDWKVFLVKLKSGSHWGFPKGHTEAKEDPFQTAIRELQEETNLTCSKIISKDPIQESYIYKKDHKTIQKTVFYYLIEAKGEPCIQQGEILDGKWYSFDQAHQILTFDEGKELLNQVIRLLQS